MEFAFVNYTVSAIREAYQVLNEPYAIVLNFEPITGLQNESALQATCTELAVT